MNETMTNVATGFSPVAEAERIARLDAAARLLEDPLLVWQRRVLDRVPGAMAARHLEGALSVLTERGWAQNQFRDESGAVCLMKALLEAADLGYGDTAETPGKDFNSTTYYVAGTYLNLMVQVRTTRSGFALGWNDEPGRTTGEVLELVADAAEFARSYA